MTDYAMYKGDKFIDLGTLQHLSKKYHKSIKNLKVMTKPSQHKLDHGKRLLLYKIEDN